MNCFLCIPNSLVFCFIARENDAKIYRSCGHKSLTQKTFKMLTNTSRPKMEN